MARTGTVALLISGACGARIHSQDVLSISAAKHPIPTPKGHKFDWDDVYRCYATSNPDANVPPGYKLSKGQKCSGKSIKKWADGRPSEFAKSRGGAFKDQLECAKECNKHEECAGFYTVNGLCSHWRRGELQDVEGRVTNGYDCYVKWEVRDLSDVKKEPPKLEPAPPQPVPKPSGKQVSDCLCVWDVDRTLTAKQGKTVEECPGTKAFEDIPDYAYNGGTLILSDLAMRINQSFCSKCYFSVVSAGTASGPSSKNRELLDSLVDPKYNVGGWVDGCPTPVWGSKVMCCGEGEDKMRAVRDIVTWLGENGVKIADDKVHFFDDKPNNIEGFKGGPFNAHQVSCGSRDGSRGDCGGILAEVVETPGQHTC